MTPSVALRTTPPLATHVLAGIWATTLLTRLPFVPGAGVGADPDAWRLLLAGEMLRASGQYTPSRPPSYPAVELLSAALAGSPWWVFVALTAAVGAAGVAAFADLLRTLGVTAWLPVTAGFALTPVIFRNDVMFMDYSWSLTALLAGLAVLARGRICLSGAAFGLAVACRPAAAVMVVVPVAVLLLDRRGQFREQVRAVARFAVPAAATAGAFFAVPLLAFGLRFLTFADEAVPTSHMLARLSTGTWGSFGAVAVAVGACLAIRRRTLRWGSWPIAAACGVLAGTVVFLRLPVDAGYLAPVVPMVWLLLGLGLSAGAVAVVAAAVAVSSFVAPSASPAFGVTVVQDRADRADAVRYAQDAARTIEALPVGTTVVAGPSMPQLLANLPGAPLTFDRTESRTVQVPEALRLPGGQLLVYRPPTTDAGDVVRLRQGLGPCPELNVRA